MVRDFGSVCDQHVQGGPKSKLLYFFHIFAKYWPIFTIFFTSRPRFCKKFATQWHSYHSLCRYITL